MKNKAGTVLLIVLSAAMMTLMTLLPVAFAEEARTEHTLDITSQVVFFAVLLCGGLMLFYLISSMKKQPYSYKNAAMVGGLLFLAFLVITVFLPLCLQYTRSSERSLFLTKALGNTLNSVYHFTELLLPLLILIFLALIASNVALIRHEGRNLHHFLGAAVSGFLIVFTVLNLFGWNRLILSAYQEEGGKAFGQVLLRLVPVLTSAVLCYLECVFIGISFCTVAAAKKQLSYDKDYMIILGCAIRKDGSLYPLLQGRVDRARDFDRDQLNAGGKELVYVPSGGQGSDECISEAEAMQRYLLSQGVEAQRILPENQSSSTLENMEFSKKMIDAQGRTDSKVAFATTNYHVFRAGVYAARAGLKAQGTGSKTKWYYWPNAFVREMIALLVDRKWSVLMNIVVLVVLCVLLALLDWKIVVA